MSHAALWVVQPRKRLRIQDALRSFNAARGFVGGATALALSYDASILGFNAARGFVCGAT